MPVMDGAATARALEPLPTTAPADYYSVLSEWERSAGRPVRTWLREARCVRLQSLQWVAPATGPFFPRQRGEVDFPAELEVPLVDLEGVSDEVRIVFEAAGVQPFVWRALITKFLLPLLQSDHTAPDRRSLALRALRQYFDADGSDPEVARSIGQVRLPVACADGSGETLRAAAKTYLGSVWDPEIETTAIYGPFGSPDFLAVPVPTDPLLRARDIEFYRWLGVEDSPRVVSVRDGDIQSHSGITLKAICQWRSTRAYRDASNCSQGHRRSQALQSAPHVDRLTDVIATRDPDRLAAMWRALGAGWTTRYSKALVARYRCTAGAHGGRQSEREIPSLLDVTLRESAWIPMGGADGNLLAKPADVWDPGSVRPSVRRRLPGLPPALRTPATAAMRAELGVIDSRLDSSRLSDLLRQLQAEARAAGGVSADLADAARWAMDNLNRCLADGESMHGRVPLLATFAGKLVMTADVVLSHDATLTETWQDVVAVFVPDAAWTDLPRALSLKDLARSITTSAVMQTRDVKHEVELQRTFDELLPELLAVACDRASARQEELAQLLRNAVIRCGSPLALHDTFDGRTRVRGQASAYMAAPTGAVTIAYVQIDASGEHDPFAFGRELAAHLSRSDIADALGILLDGRPEVRARYLRSRQLDEGSVDHAAGLLLATSAPATNTAPESPTAVVQPTSAQRINESALAADDDIDPKARSTDEELVDEPAGCISIEPTPRPERAPGTEPTREMHSDEDTDRTSGMAESTRGQTSESHVTALGADIPAEAIGASTTELTGAENRMPGGTDAVCSEASLTLPRQQSATPSVDAEPEQAERTASGGQSRFRSYVTPAGQGSAPGGAQHAALRLQIDRAGIDAVLAYERTQGRVPEEQEHDTPGYDVLSYDDDETVLRIIEVKSTASAWSVRGVTMSPPQMARNRRDGDKFWLYVVEYALDDERRTVHRIQNPAERITEYVFDDGWRRASESRTETTATA